MKDTGGEVKPKLAINPVTTLIADAGSSTFTGVVIDRKGYNSAVFSVVTGAVNVAISSGLVSWYLQEGASSTLSDAAYVTGTSQTITATTCITAASTISQINVDLTSLERYVRLYAASSLAYVDTTSTPTIGLSGFAVLGQALNKPAA